MAWFAIRASSHLRRTHATNACLNARTDFIQESLRRRSSRDGFIRRWRWASSSSSTSLSGLRSPTGEDVVALRERVGGDGGTVLWGNDDASREGLEKYNVDWKREYIGHSQIVVKPKTKGEVGATLSYCNEQRIGVVPQGGNTGLVGGSVPVSDELILSTEYMNEIHSFDETSGILTCGSGCILQDLHEYAQDRSHLIPIDLGAKGTCQIGGNVSTNAGGQYYYRFGSLHANVLGLEVVLADGTVLDLTNANRKDNTGYDLKHLFIGAEGTLGVVTKVNMSCPRLPSARNAAFLGLDTFDAVRRTLTIAKDRLGECLAAFEFMDREVLSLVGRQKPIPVMNTGKDLYRFYVLVESQGSNQEHDCEKMSSFLEAAMDSGYVVDGVLSQDLGQVQDMWEIRESCNPIVKDTGYNYKYDVSLPLSHYYEVAESMRDRLSVRSDAVAVNWGHVIDGNLHFNVVTPGMFQENPEVLNLIEPYLFETVMKRGGSISAEHGLGRCKNEYLGKLAKNPVALDVMRQIKAQFDPNGILNPSKYLPTR